MDVLELPRPVINFLRTMAKESCRYVLSWDIFGGTDVVTLTLTWKVIDDECQLPKSSQQRLNDDLSVRQNHDSISSPRRSRREEHPSASTLVRLSRGKSLEGHNHLRPNQPMSSPSQLSTSSAERSSIVKEPQSESNSIYANVSNVKYALNPSLPSSSNKTPPLSAAHLHHRRAHEQSESVVLPKVKSPIPLLNNKISKPTRTNHVATSNDDDDDDDTLDPWVKRFDSLLENNIDEITEKSKDKTNEPVVTPNKVKFKRKPDYF